MFSFKYGFYFTLFVIGPLNQYKEDRKSRANSLAQTFGSEAFYKKVKFTDFPDLHF